MNQSSLTAKEYLSQAFRIDLRIRSKIEQVQSLRDLAEKATVTFSDMPSSGTRNIDRMEDIINIESRLQDIMYQIESLKGEINYLNEAISYSTVTVYVQEVAKLTTGESIQATLSERLSKALKDSLDFFEESLVTFAIAVIYILPFLAVLSVLIFIAVKVRKKKIHVKDKEAPGPSSKE